MNRLTRKTDGRDYVLYCRQVEFDNEVLGRNDSFYEEPQEYYDRFPYQTSEVGNEEEILNKLGAIEDLEEELGIDLIILFKALINGIYVKYNSIYDFSKRARLYNSDDNKCLCFEIGYGASVVRVKDYKKTWWLKEDLQDEKEKEY